MSLDGGDTNIQCCRDNKHQSQSEENEGNIVIFAVIWCERRSDGSNRGDDCDLRCIPHKPHRRRCASAALSDMLDANLVRTIALLSV